MSEVSIHNQPDEKVEVKPDEMVEIKPDEKVEIKPDEKVEIKPDEKVEIKPDEKVEIKPDEKVEIKPDEKVEVKPDETKEIKPDEKVEVKPDETKEVKPDEKVEVKPDEKVEVKPDEKVEVKPDEKVEIKPDEKVEVKTDEKVEVKTDETKEVKPDETTIHPQKDITKSVLYASLLSKLRPFDLLLFKGTDIFSKAIRECEYLIEGYGKFSHAGLVVNKKLLPYIPELQEGRWYVWESTMSGSLDGLNRGGSVPDIETGKGRFGVQIRDLEDVIKSYEQGGAKVAWSKLIHNPWKDRSMRKDIIQTIKAFHKKYGFRIYELNPLVLLSAVFKCCHPIKNLYDHVIIDEHELLVQYSKKCKKLSKDQVEEATVFCSQFVAMVYQHIGVISPKIDPADCSPVSFMGYGKVLPRIVKNPIYINSS